MVVCGLIIAAASALSCGAAGVGSTGEDEALGSSSEALTLCREERLKLDGATASSVEDARFPASYAVDGNASTRWSSVFAERQWIQVDLNRSSAVRRVVLRWEQAAAKGYTLSIGDDPREPSKTIYTETQGNGGVDTITIPLNLNPVGRYLRVTSTERSTGFGISLFEIEVYGDVFRNCVRVCGDGDLDNFEQCDDGNLRNGDGCSSNCALEISCDDHPVQPVSVKASTTEGPNFTAARAIDDDETTRWASVWADPQWIYVDLGRPYHIGGLNLKWELAASKVYSIQTGAEPDGNWNTIFTESHGDGGVDTIRGLNGIGQYVRLLSTQRTTRYGISLFDLEILGDEDAGCGYAWPRCGDGTLDDDEECDDGNYDDGDGCSNGCTVEACYPVRLPLYEATASSSTAGDYGPSSIIDGIVHSCGGGPMWSSGETNPQWIVIVLNTPHYIDQVILHWGCGFSTDYDMQVGPSTTGPWTTVYTEKAGNGEDDSVTGLNGVGRYVRVYSRAQTNPYNIPPWGMAISEVEIYGDADVDCPR